jgi:hypothetical protein
MPFSHTTSDRLITQVTKKRYRAIVDHLVHRFLRASANATHPNADEHTHPGPVTASSEQPKPSRPSRRRTTSTQHPTAAPNTQSDPPASPDNPGQILATQDFRQWATTRLAPTITRATWKLYRAALAYVANTHSTELSNYYRTLPSELSQPKPKARTKNRRTSSLRQRGITQAQLKNILAYFQQRPPTPARTLAAALLKWGIATGLRPIEWAQSRVTEIDGRIALVVQNAKNSHGRSIGPTRTLYLSQFTTEQIEAIRALTDHAARHSKEQWRHLYASAQQALNRAHKALHPKSRNATRPTLYSARHQCVLNMRAAGYPPDVIAAAVGHVSPQTATRNYGRRRNTGRTGRGAKPPLIVPAQSDVERVNPIRSTKGPPQRTSRIDPLLERAAQTPAPDYT